MERDTGRNGVQIRERVLRELETILDSDLAVPQKVHLFNTALVPEAV